MAKYGIIYENGGIQVYEGVVTQLSINEKVIKNPTKKDFINNGFQLVAEVEKPAEEIEGYYWDKKYIDDNGTIIITWKSIAEPVKEVVENSIDKTSEDFEETEIYH